MAKCQHEHQEFLDVQRFGNGIPALDLYNCLDCKTTLSRPHKENDMEECPYCKQMVVRAEMISFRGEWLCGDCYEQAIPSSDEIQRAERNFGA